MNEQTNDASTETPKSEMAKECHDAIELIFAQDENLAAIRALVGLCLREPMDQDYVRRLARTAGVGVVQVEDAMTQAHTTLTDAETELLRAVH